MSESLKPCIEKKWLKRHSFKLALGAAALSSVIMLSSDSLSETVDEAVDAAPWVGTGLVAGEALWCVGAGMMLAAGGRKIRSPMKLHEEFKNMPVNVKDSKLFHSGFWLNTSAAVSQAGVIGAGIATTLPQEAWGIMALPAVDLAATIAARREIMKKVHNSQADTYSDTNTGDLD